MDREARLPYLVGMTNPTTTPRTGDTKRVELARTHPQHGSYYLDRTVYTIAYALSGNAHNPTITYIWTVRLADGTLVGDEPTKRGAVELVEEHAEQVTR